MSVTIDREMKIKKPSKFLRLRRFLFWIIFKSNRLHWRGRLQQLLLQGYTKINEFQSPALARLVATGEIIA